MEDKPSIKSSDRKPTVKSASASNPASAPQIKSASPADLPSPKLGQADVPPSVPTTESIESVAHTREPSSTGSGLSNQSNRRLAFIGMGVALVAILAVGLFAPKGKAQSASTVNTTETDALIEQDKSHFRQLFTGLSLYSSDFDDLLPPALNYKAAISPYVKSEQIFLSLNPAPGGGDVLYPAEFQYRNIGEFDTVEYPLIYGAVKWSEDGLHTVSWLDGKVARISPEALEQSLAGLRTGYPVIVPDDVTPYANDSTQPGAPNEDPGREPEAPTLSALHRAIERLARDASVRDLSPEELGEYSVDELRLVRNCIFALKGRTFESEDLHGFFRSYPWYSGSPGYEPQLTEIEQANLDLIKSLEGT